MQQKIAGVVGEAAGCRRLAIAVGNVGLDIENWRSIHQVRTAHMEYRAEFFGVLCAQQPHT